VCDNTAKKGGTLRETILAGSYKFRRNGLCAH
jgi:hypothetical protein